MNTSLHRANGNSVIVRNFPKSEETKGFASVTVSDDSGNDVTLFFANLGEVVNFALMIKQEASNI